MKVVQISLDGLRLPEATEVLRQHTRPEDERSAHYLECYDRHTLFYDAVRLPGQDRVLLTGPPLLNLWPILRDNLYDDRGHVRGIRRQKFERCEQVSLPLPRGSLKYGPDGSPITVRTPVTSTFAGLNALMTINRNNDLDWIRDWARFHIERHGAQAVVIFDNGSTEYEPQDLADRLSTLPKLEALAIVSAPFPYGVVDGGQGLGRPAFLQPAMMNMARRDMLAQARAVLNIDIDELVWARGGESIFDAACARPNTMVKIHGRWAYPAPDALLPAPQRTHTHRAVPDKRCRQKWAAVPSGFLSRFGWAAHQVGGPLVKIAKKDPRFELIHCRGTSTGWKDKRFDLPERRFDPELADFMAGQFG